MGVSTPGSTPWVKGGDDNHIAGWYEFMDIHKHKRLLWVLRLIHFNFYLQSQLIVIRFYMWGMGARWQIWIAQMPGTFEQDRHKSWPWSNQAVSPCQDGDSIASGRFDLWLDLDLTRLAGSPCHVGDTCFLAGRFWRQDRYNYSNSTAAGRFAMSWPGVAGRAKPTRIMLEIVRQFAHQAAPNLHMKITEPW